MIDGIYKIKIDAPLVNNSGTVELRTDGDEALCKIQAPVVGKQRIKVKVEDDTTFNARGKFWLFLAGMVRYSLRGVVEGDSLRVEIKSNRGVFKIAGKRVS